MSQHVTHMHIDMTSSYFLSEEVLEKHVVAAISTTRNCYQYCYRYNNIIMGNTNCYSVLHFFLVLMATHLQRVSSREGACVSKHSQRQGQLGEK